MILNYFSDLYIFSYAFWASGNNPETVASFLVSIHPLPRELAHLKQKWTHHLYTCLDLFLTSPGSFTAFDLDSVWRAALLELSILESFEKELDC